MNDHDRPGSTCCRHLNEPFECKECLAELLLQAFIENDVAENAKHDLSLRAPLYHHYT